MTKEKPILFSGEMIKAILDGRKTQTRRVINPQPTEIDGAWHWAHRSYDNGDGVHYFHTDEASAKRLLLTSGISPKSGEHLWVKETWRAHLCSGRDTEQIHYGAYGVSCPNDGETIKPWKPSLFMPRWASRITLEVTDVRVQRLQEISEKDAEAEGCFARFQFQSLWDSIQLQRSKPNGEFSWSANPWVWAITFRRRL